MHRVTYIRSLVQFGDFLIGLYQPHRHHCLDEFFGGVFAHTVEGDTQQAVDLNHVVVTVRWEIMYPASGGAGCAYIVVKCSQRGALGDCCRGGFLRNQRLGTHPDDVIDIHVVSEQNFLSGIHVYDSCQIGLLQAEVVDECTVLTVAVLVARVIDSGVGSSEEQKNA